MKVEFTNPNIIVSTSRKTQFKAAAQPVTPVTPVASAKLTAKDPEAMYSKAVAIGSISVLAGLGIAMLHKEKVTDFISNVRKHISDPKAIIKPLRITTAHGGPDIDITKGQTAIADAWNSYIKAIDKRVNDTAHKTNKSKYIDLFKNNAKKLDMLEALANEMSTNRTKSFVVCA